MGRERVRRVRRCGRRFSIKGGFSRDGVCGRSLIGRVCQQQLGDSMGEKGREGTKFSLGVFRQGVLVRYLERHQANQRFDAYNLDSRPRSFPDPVLAWSVGLRRRTTGGRIGLPPSKAPPSASQELVLRTSSTTTSSDAAYSIRIPKKNTDQAKKAILAPICTKFHSSSKFLASSFHLLLSNLVFEPQISPLLTWNSLYHQSRADIHFLEDL